MEWHDIRDPHAPELDRLAERYHLHPLHIEDCRHGGQRAKAEEGQDYLFIVLKPVTLTGECDLVIGDFDIFIGRDFLITVMESGCPAHLCEKLDQLKSANHTTADQLFYRLFDGIVDSYVPTLDKFSDVIDGIEDKVLETPSPDILQRIFNTKRNLIEMRRVLGNMRDVASHLQRTETELIRRDLWPFLRDVYDHLARDLDMVEMHRDILTGAMDIYLSAVANRTNQVMKVLTVLGTIALPSIVISGFFGMNTADLPLVHSPYGTEIAVAAMVVSTGILLYTLKKFDWW